MKNSEEKGGWLFDLVLSVTVNNFQSYWDRANTSYVFLVLLESKWILLKDTTFFSLFCSKTLVVGTGWNRFTEISWNQYAPLFFKVGGIKKKKKKKNVPAENWTFRLQILHLTTRLRPPGVTRYIELGGLWKSKVNKSNQTKQGSVINPILSLSDGNFAF